jgi:hypothetical protein
MEILFDNPKRLTFSMLLEEADGALYWGVPHVIPEKPDAWQRLPGAGRSSFPAWGRVNAILISRR